MKRSFTAIVMALALSSLCAATAFAAGVVVAGPQGGSSGSSASYSGGTITGYDPYEEAAKSIPQPPVRNDLTDYDLPFTCVYMSGLAYIYEGPSDDSLKISMSDPGEYFRYLGEEGNYYKILFDGKEAYITKSGASLKNTLKMDPGLVIRAELVKAAFNNLGAAYSYGGTSAATGFDCSGFLYATYTACGIPLGRSTAEQSVQGTSIDVSQIRPGDLIYYADATGTIDHGAMYVGNGMLIHAHSSVQGVRMQSYNYKSMAPVRINNMLGDQN